MFMKFITDSLESWCQYKPWLLNVKLVKINKYLYTFKF